MCENTSRIHYVDKKLLHSHEFVLIFLSYLIGILVAIIYNSEISGYKNAECIIKSLDSVFTDNQSAVAVFKALLLQLKSELLFILIALAASYAVVPKTFLSIITGIKGYSLAKSIKAIFDFTPAIPMSSKTIAIVFGIGNSLIYINFAIKIFHIINLSNNDAGKNELALIISAYSRTRLYHALTACGSLILLNLLKSLLLLIISFL